MKYFYVFKVKEMTMLHCTGNILSGSTMVFVVCYPFNEILVVNLPKIINTDGGLGVLGVVMTNSKVNMIILCHTQPGICAGETN